MPDAFNPSAETKAFDANPHAAPASGAAVADLARAFESFRDANDERLASLEAQGGADAILEEKLARIETALDDGLRRLDALSLKAARPPLAAPDGGRPNREAARARGAFDAYVRAGDARGLEEKALATTPVADGGTLAPAETEAEVMRRLALLSPIRALATVRQTASGTYKKAYSTNGFAAGWVGEQAARPQTNTPVLAELSFPAMELYAMPAATQALLDDAVVDIDRWLADEIEGAFAEQESAAFVNGTGVNQPRGFLNHPKVAQASWSWGNLGYVATGAAGAFPGANPSDVLLDLVYALKAPFRANARFLMSRKTQATIRKFKASTGEYLWSPPAAAGQPATLLGFPVVECEDMPEIGADAFAIAFGDFRRGYLVADRVGLRILRDPFSAKPYVLFYTTKRVGGGVQDFDAIKLLKFATT